MRVISGLAKGSKLFAPDGLDVRPTLDRVKESIFSMLFGHIENSEVLDLFAGTGALGIEALSRGACSCYFVDMSIKSINCVKRNLEKTRLSDKSVLHLSKADDFLRNCSHQFDIVFVDPPYSKGIEISALENLKACLHSDSIVVLETEKEPEKYDGYEIIKFSRYGRVFITLLKKDVLL